MAGHKTIFTVGTTSVDTDTDLRLIQQRVDISPPEPQLNLVDIPGRDGPLDLTESLGVGVKYKARTLAWTFALRPGESWEAAKSSITNAIHGRRVRAELSTDPGWYYDGRAAVRDYLTDNVLRQITVEATCQPYKLRHQHQRRPVYDFPEVVRIDRGVMPTQMTFTVEEPTTVWIGDYHYTLPVGTSTPTWASGTGVFYFSPVNSGTYMEIDWEEGSF